MALNWLHIVLFGVSFTLLLLIHRTSSRKCETMNFVRPDLLGGTETTRGEWPFVAAIQNRSDFTFCCGTIISNKNILTGEVEKF